MAEALDLAVNAAISSYQIARARYMAFHPGMDVKRLGAWETYGWPDKVTTDDLYNLYRRGGVGHGAVEKIVGACWKTRPWVIEGDEQDEATDETAWERKLKPMLGYAFWQVVAEADRRRLVCRYSGLILRIADNRAWDQSVQAGRALTGIVPAWAGALTPTNFDTDPKSQTFGEPRAWTYKQAGIAGGPGSQVTIHRDRVFILGDYSADAIGFLEPAYNAFVNLEKVEGGSGESFLKNAARQLNINFDREVDLAGIASMYGVTLEELQGKFDQAAREVNRGNDMVLPTQGATVTPLVATVPDPTPTYTVNIQTIAAALDIPQRILVGNQTGNLASTEDREYFNARCQARREDLGFEIHQLVEHLMTLRIVDTVPAFAVMWDDLTEAKQADRLANAKVMSDINTAAMATGEPVFGTDEIRSAAGFDAEDAPDPLGEDDDGDEATGANPAEE